MLVRLIILPITPAAELDDAISTGLIPSFAAVTVCSGPKSALAEVSLPVKNTPSQPSIALKKGNIDPVAANASPSVPVAPEKFIRYASPSTAASVNSASASCFAAFPITPTNCPGFIPTANDARIAANRHDVPAPDSHGNRYTAP